ncbi:hypothetical protein E4U47_003955, partial [Claviceps purpurea]
MATTHEQRRAPASSRLHQTRPDNGQLQVKAQACVRIHLRSHEATELRSNGTTLPHPREYENTPQGFQNLPQRLTRFGR